MSEREFLFEERPIKKLENFISRNPIVKKAHDLAKRMHEGQTRDQGTPYFSDHLYPVAQIIYEEWGIENPNMVAAAFLHDTIEDTSLTLEEIVYLFDENGAEIAFLVEGVTQFKSEKSLTKEENDRETLRKVFNKNLIDPKVGVLKLADRLHSMRTMDTALKQKQVPKSKETLEVYSSLAESLGMWVVKRELENLALKYADPENYKKYWELLNLDSRTNNHFIAYMTTLIATKLHNEGVNSQVFDRITSLARLREKSKTRLFKDIDDVVSFRVIVDGKNVNESKANALKALGIIWSEFGNYDDPERFDNFYYIPRDNGYSAFQVTLNLEEGAVKIVVASEEKEDYNNWGVVSLLRSGITDLRENSLKLVFTPTGQVRFFPERANGYDFAYHIDERMGAQATEMIINGKKVDIASVIPNGATVQILVGEYRMVPDKNALFHTLPKTAKKISKQFLELEMADQETKGREIVTKIVSLSGILDLEDLFHIAEHTPKLVETLYRLGAKSSLKRLYQSVGSGVLSEQDLVSELDRNNITKKSLGLTSITVQGSDEKGLLNYYSSRIVEIGGNIRWIEGGGDNSRFTIHMVVEGLSGNSEQNLKKFLEEDKRIDTLLLV